MEVKEIKTNRKVYQYKNVKKEPLGKYLKKNWDMYLLLVPALTYVTIFQLLPMCGIQIAFRDYNMFLEVDGESVGPFMAMFKSPFVGLKYFREVFSRPEFFRALRNTLIISIYKIIIVFPLPIIFAVFLNEIRSAKFQKGLQLVVYMPHFLSWVVVGGIFTSMLNSTGLVNTLLSNFNIGPINFLMDTSKFRSILIISDAWKGLGWNSIVYFAAITGLDQECYEAARVDGAGRFQEIWHITLPGLLPTIVLMLIIRVGNIMSAGFDQVFVMYNSTVYEVADIIETYVYRMGLGKLEFSTGTAVGLFNSVVSLILVLSSNFVAKRTTGKSIW